MRCIMAIPTSMVSTIRKIQLILKDLKCTNTFVFLNLFCTLKFEKFYSYVLAYLKIQLVLVGILLGQAESFDQMELHLSMSISLT